MTNSPLPPGTRVNAYLRDSGGDDQDLSTDQQLQAIQRYCQENNLLLIHSFIDRARPGSSTIGREAFEDMLKCFRVRQPTEAALLIWSFSRFARDFDDAQYFKADLRRRDIQIISLHETIPPGLDGKLYEAILDWMSARYLADLSRDIKRGLHHLVETYGAVPGLPPVGFRRVPLEIGQNRRGQPRIVHRWEPDPNQLAQVKLAWQMRAQGASYPEIHQATHLHAALNSYPTFYRNRLYIGTLVFGSLTIPNYCAPIIDLATWNQVQARCLPARLYLADGDRPDHPNRTRSRALLSGLAVCARCGSKLNRETAGSRVIKWPYYICNKSKRRAGCDAPRLSQVDLEQHVMDHLLESLLTPENLADIQAQRQSARTDNHVLLEEQKTTNLLEQRRCRQQQANLVNAITAHGHSPLLLQRLAELETEEQRLRVEYDRLANQVAVATDQPDDPAELAALLRHLLTTLELPLRRRLLQRLIARLAVDRHGQDVQVEILYRLPLKKNDIIPPAITSPPTRPPLWGTLPEAKSSFSFRTRQNKTG